MGGSSFSNREGGTWGFFVIRTRKILQPPIFEEPPLSSSKKSHPTSAFFHSIFDPFFDAEDRTWGLFDFRCRGSKFEEGCSSTFEFEVRFFRYSESENEDREFLRRKKAFSEDGKFFEDADSSKNSISHFRITPHLRITPHHCSSTTKIEELRSPEPKIGSKIAIGPVVQDEERVQWSPASNEELPSSRG